MSVRAAPSASSMTVTADNGTGGKCLVNVHAKSYLTRVSTGTPVKTKGSRACPTGRGPSLHVRAVTGQFP